jgi:oligosaccharyltransferase complex subunit beta
MRWLFSSALVLAWSAAVAAKSYTGDRLLVVLEEQSDREKYSVFLEDLAGKWS